MEHGGPARDGAPLSAAGIALTRAAAREARARVRASAAARRMVRSVLARELSRRAGGSAGKFAAPAPDEPTHGEHSGGRSSGRGCDSRATRGGARAAEASERAAEAKAAAKRAVNGWLAACVREQVAAADADAAGERGDTPTWALVLETEALRTVSALAADGATRVSVATTVVPNPHAAEREAMAAREPRLNLFPSTSHDLIAALAAEPKESAAASADADAEAIASSADGAPAQLRFRGWPGAFGVVWLDYCGSLSSRAGRQRQLDILRLFRGRLLARDAVLAVTLSERGGGAALYPGEAEDALAALVAHAADVEACGFYGPVVPLGRVAYAVQAKMVTVAVAVGGRGAAAAAAARRLGAALQSPLQWHHSAPGECAAAAVSAFAAGTPSGLTLAALAEQDAASAFASVAAAVIEVPAATDAPDGSSPAAALACDSKLLPAARAMRKGLGPAADVRASIDDPIDALVANAVATRVATDASVGKCACQEASAAITTAAEAGGVDALWLHYGNRPGFTAAHLRAGEWRDLARVFACGALRAAATASRRASVLGIVLPYSTTSEVWEGSGVDWFVHGVQRLATSHSSSRPGGAMAAHPVGVWMYNAASSKSLMALFVVTSATATPNGSGGPVAAATAALAAHCVAKQAPRGCTRVTPRAWATHAERLKRPAPSARAFARVAPYAAALAAHACACGGGGGVVVHEPGFASVWPQVLERCGALGAAALACAAGDTVVHDELVRRHGGRCGSVGVSGDVLPRVEVERGDERGAEGATAWSHSRAVILLGEAGTAAWVEMWAPRVRSWLAIALEEGTGPLAIVASYDSCGADGGAAVERAIVEATDAAGGCAQRVARGPLRLASRRAELTAWLLADSAPLLAAASDAWLQAAPPQPT